MIPVLCCSGCFALGTWGALTGDRAFGDQIDKDDTKLKPPLLAGIVVFLEQHSEFGTPTGTEAIPNWAKGERQRVSFSGGRNLLFYLKEGQVQTVYEDGSDGRKAVWGEGEVYEAPKREVRAKSSALPKYELEKIDLIGGGTYGDVIVKSLSRKTSVQERKRIALEIAEKEGLDELCLYCTTDARKANFSESYSNSHPNAMRRGFLGTWKDGEFTAGEKLYP